MPICFLNSPPNDKYSNLLIVAAFLASLFLVKRLCHLKTHINKDFLIIKFDCLKCIEVCFVRFFIFGLSVIL